MTNYNGYTSRAQVIRDLRAAGFTFSTALGATESNPKLAKGAKLGVLSNRITSRRVKSPANGIFVQARVPVA